MIGSLKHLNLSSSTLKSEIDPKSATTSVMTSPVNSNPPTPYYSLPPTPHSGLSIATSVATSIDEDEKVGLASYESPYSTPPAIKNPYNPQKALKDIPGLQYALKLFLESHMLESEEYCHESDEKKERLYFATGFSLIQCVKGLMSYEDDDLLSALKHARHGNHIASQHRKRQALLGTLVSVIHSGGVGWIRSMSTVERHAELVYAESLFEKALLGIVYSGDWLAFIKEALNMRTTIAIYRQLMSYIEALDAEYVAAGRGPTNPDVDPHFRSGVYLGMGMSNIVLSLMPGKLMTIVELFGYKGDRKVGLDLLMKAGGWGEGVEPGVTAADEGLRRTICDMSLLIFHLVISSFTFDGVDIPLASRILAWNLKRFPNGIFFLFGAGRLALIRSQPALALSYYRKAMASQTQYKNLDHISYWEMAVAHLAMWDVKGSEECWRVLEKDATWSKSIYKFGLAVCMLEEVQGMKEGEEGREEKRREVEELMKKVPEVRQRIAGKSIPLEKYVSRKARKFASQKHLTLPALELAYTFQSIGHAPRHIILTQMLPEVDSVLKILASYKGKEKEYEKKFGAYYDDLVLARFLQGVCLRYVVYPDQDSAEADGNEDVWLEEGAEGIEVKSEPMSEEEKVDVRKRAEEAFREVFVWGPKVELDHHLVYHAHYELGRLLACEGRLEEATVEFELVLSGKYLEVGSSGRKGKYSLENALHVRTHAAMQALPQGKP